MLFHRFETEGVSETRDPCVISIFTIDVLRFRVPT